MKKLLIILLFSISVLAQGSSNINKQTAKTLYTSSIILLLAHRSTIDAWIWENKENPIPSFIKKDYYYLGGTVITLILLAITSNNYNDNFWGYAKTTIGAFLIGSVLWDLIFSSLIYKDALYPVPNWYGGFGFHNRTERISFDLLRLGTGILLLLK